MIFGTHGMGVLNIAKVAIIATYIFWIKNAVAQAERYIGQKQVLSGR
jgi:hypothetical protein